MNLDSGFSSWHATAVSDACFAGSGKEQTVFAPYRGVYIMISRYEPAGFLPLVVGCGWLAPSIKMGMLLDAVT